MPPRGIQDNSLTGKMNRVGQSIGKIGSWSQKQHTGNMRHAVKLLQRNRKDGLSLDRVVEACYLPKYANVLIKLSDTHFMGEAPRFIAAVNWLEGSVGGSMGLGYDIDWGEMDTPNCTPPAIAQWTLENLVYESSRYANVNLNHALKTALRNPGALRPTIRKLQSAKLYVAGRIVHNLKKQMYENQETYLRNVWDFNAKLLHDSHSSDIGPGIQAMCDSFCADGVSYNQLSDTVEGGAS